MYLRGLLLRGGRERGEEGRKGICGRSAKEVEEGREEPVNSVKPRARKVGSLPR